MINFSKNLLLFLIPLLVTSGVLEFYIRNRETGNEILAKKALSLDKADARIIFLGNSHGRNAFIPQLIHPNSLNLCIGGSTVYYNTKFLESLLTNLPKIKYLVYNISYQTLFYDLQLLEDEKKKYEFLHYLNVDAGVKKSSPHYFSILSTIGLKGALESIKSDLFNESINWKSTLGWKKEVGVIDLKNLQHLAEIRIDLHNDIMNEDKLDYNIEQLESIQKIAKRRNIKVIYVVIPTLKEYQKQQIDKFRDFAKITKNFAAEYDALFINLSDSVEMQSSDFVDPDHVNEQGAIKISNFLSDFFRTHLDESDKR